MDKCVPVLAIADPGRPPKPVLVPPLEVPRRKATSATGRAALLHAIAHIEFNAINLALDAAYRFRGMPRAFYGDWLQVASEEALHFSLVRDHLQSLGYAYGDFPAHNGLWEMAVKTAHDPLVRMALVPRVLESRGLDATPAIVKKFKSVQDARAVEILAVIERDEIGNVALTAAAKEYLADKGYDPVYGASSLKRLIQRDVQDELAMKFLEGEFSDYDRVRIDLRGGLLVCEKNGRSGRPDNGAKAVK